VTSFLVKKKAFLREAASKLTRVLQ